MSDLRARLADALREHYLWDEFNNTDGRRARCRCDLTNPSITNGVPDGGWMPFEDYATHVADVLLSLPGIAIVDRKPIEGLIASFRRVEVLQLYDAATHRWVDLVAELLAAANAAEQAAD